VDAIEKKLDTIVDNYNKKTTLNTQNLKKLNTALEEVSKILDKTPFEGGKAITAINTATTAVARQKRLDKPRNSNRHETSIYLA